MKKTLRFFLSLLLVFSGIGNAYCQSACPQVTVAPAGPICTGNCVNLTATVQGSVATTSYGVSSIPYTPYSFTGGNPVLVNIDDTWSSVVTMPFCFQFFGNTYTQFVIGSNALISFDITQAGGYCQWPISAAIPSNTNPMNSIMAPFHDIDPSVGTPTSATDINWAVYGTAPCRYMVVNWNDVAMFSCTNLIATSQLVLHETTNIIDIYIKDKPTCASWNAGAAIEGIQDATGTTAFFVPGRNFPTNWSVSNDGQRFMPNGAPQYTLDWTGPSGSLGSANPITVCPTSTSTYTCTVTNPTCSGNVVVSASTTVVVTPGLTVTGSQTNSTSCLVCNGTATTTVTVGTGPFTYAWAPSGGTAATATGLCAGTYTCTVTNPSGCTGTQTFTITAPTAPTSTQSLTNVSCNGGCNGTGTITPSPVAAYTYAWSPSGGTSATATGLCAGTYTVTATNAGGCVTTQTITITAPPALTATQSQVNILCNGACTGSATVVAGGGSPGYTYSWAPSGGTAATTTGRCAGMYTCTITDANGCTITNTFNITQPPLLTATSSSTPATCGGNNGTVTANPGGGTPGYTYSWNSIPVQTSATATGLVSGSYTCTITDANGCTTTTVAVVGSTGGITASLSASANVSCFGGNNGSATAVPNGGTGPYTYSWTTVPIQTSSTATGLTIGSYTCTITDANGCIATVSVTITQPSALSATGSQVNNLCNGGLTGSASVVTSGGTPNYSYSWSTFPVQTTATATGLGAGSYTCTITDANGCSITNSFTITQPSAITATTSTTLATCGSPNGSATVSPSGGSPGYTYSWSTIPIQTSATATGLLAGTYTVTITDANGCTQTATANVSNAGGPTSAISASSNVSCFGGSNGSASVNVTGGTGPFTYSWNSVPVQTTTTATNLPAGSYDITVTDANGCITLSNVTITEPPALTISATSFDVDCFGNATGNAAVIVGGGAPGYSYSWNSAPVQTSANATGLTAGSYTCTATDNNGCIITQSVAITEPPVLTLASAGFNVTCFNSCDGQVVVIPSGGVPSYSFLWNTGCNNPSCNNICAGSYSVTVTDANGCIATSSTTVTQPTAIAIVTSEIDAHCNQADGSASSVGSGGTGTLSYQWIGGPANANYNNISAGTYSVIVSDANGCADTATVMVNNLNGVNTLLTSVTNLTCFNSNDGAIVTSANGGTAPYSYSWTAPASSTTGTATSLSAGNYTLTVTDATGCSSTVSATITQPTAVTIAATATPPSICSGAGIQLSSIGSGGTPGYSYTWYPGSLPGNTQNIVPTTTTTYSVVVVDANGCSDSTTVIITVNPVPVAMLVGDVLSGCAPVCVNFSDSSTIAVPGIINSWSWDFGDNSTISTQQNPTHCFAIPGSYTITLNIVTADGCTSAITMPTYINIFANPIADFSVFPQPTSILSPTISFTDNSTNATSWNWSFGDIANSTSTMQNPSFTYSDPTCYDVILAVATSDGCVDTTSEQICIDPDANIFVPNAFSPNDDGINDLFMPLGVGIDPDHFEMWIFDRWGNLIFFTDDMSKGWDGRVRGHEEISQIDTYVWKIKAMDILGHKHNIEGKVSLIK